MKELFLLCCHSLPVSEDTNFITNGLLVPIVTSLVAAGIVFLITDFILPCNKFNKLSDNYDIFWIKDWDIGGDEIDFSKPMGEAEIKYKRKNKLEVIHKQTMHDNYSESIDHQWKGTLVMETSEYGTVAFYYTTLFGKPLEKNKHRLGFKRVIYNIDSRDKKIIYLIGADGYGKEVLIEKNKV